MKRMNESVNIYSLLEIRFQHTRLLRKKTGPRDSPSVQQQQRQPHMSHFKLKGMLLLKIAFTPPTVVLNSSGANCISSG